MLINCPECCKQISDQAIDCPNCGFPINKKPKQTSRKHKRLPNGFGQITKIKNLREPYRAMVTVSKNEFGRPICKLLKPKSYFKTYNEAYSALVEYNKNPYDVNNRTTMNDLFELWIRHHAKNRNADYEYDARGVWKYCKSIHDVEVQNINVLIIRSSLENAFMKKSTGEIFYPTKNTLRRIKIILDLMLDYAMGYGLVDKNYSRMVKTDLIEPKKTVEHLKEHRAYNDEELNIMFEHSDDPIVRLILIQCYSGWRPSELLSLKLENINLEENWFKGGLKTENGKNRNVPILEKIRELVKTQYDESASKHLNVFTNMSYPKFLKLFNKTLDDLKISNHSPHDGRLTFVTLAKKYKVDEYVIKKCVGHKISDITEAVYTDRDIEWIRHDLEKISV